MSYRHAILLANLHVILLSTIIILAVTLLKARLPCKRFLAVLLGRKLGIKRLIQVDMLSQAKVWSRPRFSQRARFYHATQGDNKLRTVNRSDRIKRCRSVSSHESAGSWSWSSNQMPEWSPASIFYLCSLTKWCRFSSDRLNPIRTFTHKEPL